MKPNPICFLKQEFKFKNEGERDFEKKRTNEITQNELLHFLLDMPRRWKTKIILLRQLSNLSYTNVAQINNSK